MTFSSGSNPGIDFNITFISFVDLPRAVDFYENVMGFSMLIDQGVCKIYQASLTGYVGLVDDEKGFIKAATTKSTILCFQVPDADAWHEFIQSKEIEIYREIKDNIEAKLRCFWIKDTEDHIIEIQSALD